MDTNKEMYSEKNIVMTKEMYRESGEWWPKEGKFWLNYSSILNELIHAAGRICTHYASDLFIMWQHIMKDLGTPGYEGGTYLFAFREMGVDGYREVLSALNNEGVDAVKTRYEEVYILDVACFGHNAIPPIKMIFGRAKFEEKRKDESNLRKKERTLEVKLTAFSDGDADVNVLDPETGLNVTYHCAAKSTTLQRQIEDEDICRELRSWISLMVDEMNTDEAYE